MKKRSKTWLLPNAGLVE
jgi:hypothetical protein